MFEFGLTFLFFKLLTAILLLIYGLDCRSQRARGGEIKLSNFVKKKKSLRGKKFASV
jgi:hypothetical protein